MNSVEPDRPIEGRSRDLLGRAPFAENLAKAILNYAYKDTLVIGLYGAWGSGKTSIINMVIEYAENPSNRRTDQSQVIVRFNP